MTEQIKIYLRLAGIGVFASVCFGAGWGVSAWYSSNEVNTTKLQYANARSDALVSTLTQLKEVTRQRDALMNKLSAIDGKYATQIEGAKNEAVLDCVRRGACGVRVKATCPAARTANVPASAAGGSVDTGAGAELTAQAGRDYATLREGIRVQKLTLDACQESLGNITGQR